MKSFKSICVRTCVCVRDGDKMSVLASILDLIEESSIEVSSVCTTSCTTLTRGYSRSVI